MACRALGRPELLRATMMHPDENPYLLSHETNDSNFAESLTDVFLSIISLPLYSFIAKLSNEDFDDEHECN